MTVAGVHLGPILIVAVMLVDLAGMAYLVIRLGRLERKHGRIVGMLISHGWAEADGATPTGLHALRSEG